MHKLYLKTFGKENGEVRLLAGKHSILFLLVSTQKCVLEVQIG